MKFEGSEPFTDTTHETAQPGESPTLHTLLDPANVDKAWERVRRNNGCAGVDGITTTELKPVFKETWSQVERELRSEKYIPRPLLRVRIPKPSGGERLLGIPTVMDRIIQQAVAQVFAICWETRFSSKSYAYRPGRGVRDALTAVENAINRGAEHVFHLDIENFFDNVPHPVALTAVSNELADERIATLVRRILNCGVYEQGVVRQTSIGLAQGSPLSPLLANAVLHQLDIRLESTGWEFARYADDCVVLLPSRDFAPKIQKIVVETLAFLGLRLNKKKTVLTHFTQARFLGFAFRNGPQGQAIHSVSPEALTEASQSFLQFARTAGNEPLRVARELAEMLRSWLAFFYTPYDEKILCELVNEVGLAWKERFPNCAIPSYLQWETLGRSRRFGEHMGYSGHFQNNGSTTGAVDWMESIRYLLFRQLRSGWWRLEYDLGCRNRPVLRLCVGRHRINLRF